MPKEKWRSVTLKEETIDRARETLCGTSNMSVQDLLEHVVLVVQRWRWKYRWDNWHKPPEEVDRAIVRVEKNQAY